MFLKDWNLINDEELTCTEKSIVRTLMYHQLNSPNCTCTIGQEKLGKEVRRTRATINKLMPSIQRKGWVIITRQFNPRNGYEVNEYRLVEEKFRHEGKHNSTSSVNSVDTPMYNDPTEVCITSLHKDNRIKTKKTKIKEKVFAGKPATPQNNKNQETIGEDKNITSYTMKTNTPANVPALEKILRVRIPELFPTQTYLAPFTDKEYGQLGNYIDKLGDNDPVKVIDAVLSNWDKFRWFIDNLNSHGSYQNLPSIPSISTIARHASQTVNFMNYLEKEEAGKITALKIFEAREQQVAIEKGTKEEALLKAQENMTEEEINIENYPVQFNRIYLYEQRNLDDNKLDVPDDVSDVEYERALLKRCNVTLARLISQGTLFLKDEGELTLDCIEVSSYEKSDLISQKMFKWVNRT